MFDRFRVWIQGHPRDVAITAVLGVMAFAVAVASLTALSRRDDGVAPLIAEPAPSRSAATAVPTESAEAEPLAPASTSPAPSESPKPTPSKSPSPLPIRAGRWAGVAEVRVAGQEFGCTSTRKTIRRPATLVVSAPDSREGNVVHLQFLSSQQGVEGAFKIVSSAGTTRSWTLGGDGVGGLVGQLTVPATTSLGGAEPTDNVLAAQKSLDERCGASFSAPVNYPMAGGSALRVTLNGKRPRALLTGGTADHTRTFRIAFIAGANG